ncbi:hypothetical protein DB41_GC00030 [Neochlamydia sp. TUME1]|nr:hypothetical protein DB41_GC00030 [Neochlamydia sp. TUME1]
MLLTSSSLAKFKRSIERIMKGENVNAFPLTLYTAFKVCLSILLFIDSSNRN